MIESYLPGNTNYERNGDHVLSPTKCELKTEINGTWKLETIVPFFDAEYLKEQSVIKAPTPNGDQLFRVYDVDTTHFDCSVTAYPIFLDSRYEVFLDDTRPTDCTGQEALDWLFKNQSKYSGASDITAKSTAYWVDMNAVECISSDEDNSFLKRWGGEIAYDNFSISINNRLGADNGARAEFGFNISSIEEKRDYSGLVTCVKPKGYNGRALRNNACVYSEKKDLYPILYKKVVSFENIVYIDDLEGNEASEDQVVYNTLDSYEAALKDAAAEYLSENDVPSYTYTIDIVDLANTDEYKQYKDALELHLGDTITCRDEKLGVEKKLRVISMTYDCIEQKTTEITIGEPETTYFSKSSDVVSTASKVLDTENQTVKAESVSGVVDMTAAQLKAQQTATKRETVRAILFEDLDKNSDTFGALAIGTQGIQISHVRNSENTEWEWGTCITYKSIVADYIITGMLTDRKGVFHLNMDTGELVMNDGLFKGTLNTEKNANIGENLRLRWQKSQNAFSKILLGGESVSGSNPSVRLSSWGTDSTEYDGVQLRAKDDNIYPSVIVDMIGDKPSISLYISDTKYITLSSDGLSVKDGSNGGSGVSGTFTFSSSISTALGFVTEVR